MWYKAAIKSNSVVLVHVQLDLLKTYTKTLHDIMLLLTTVIDTCYNMTTTHTVYNSAEIIIHGVQRGSIWRRGDQKDEITKRGNVLHSTETGLMYNDCKRVGISDVYIPHARISIVQFLMNTENSTPCDKISQFLKDVEVS